MMLIRVPDMHCQKCVERITKALINAGFDIKVDLETKLVTINGETIDESKAIAELEDLGFTPQLAE